MAENKSINNSKNQILDAALEVFVKKGYSETRMDDIVKKSGLSKGAIYHHYKSKRDLFLSLIEHWEQFSFPNIFDKDLNIVYNTSKPDKITKLVKFRNIVNPCVNLDNGLKRTIKYYMS